LTKIAAWCTPDTKETLKAATKAGSKPRLVGSNSSCSPRSSITSNSAPIKFILPKRHHIEKETSGDAELSTGFIILEGKEITVDNKKSAELPDSGRTKERNSISMKEIDFSKDIRKQLCLDDLSSSRTIGHEENKDEPIYFHRQAQSIDLSMTAPGYTRGAGSKSYSRTASREVRRRRSKSTLMRKGSTFRRVPSSFGRMRSSSSNTPRSGSIQKEFRIGENHYSAKKFLEKKISC